MRAGRLSVVLGAIAIATLVATAVPDRTHAHVPEVAGLVQEWSPDLRHLVLDGVEYELSPEFEVVDQDGRVLSAFQVSVGSMVRVVEHDGVVHTVVLLPSGTGQ